MRRLGAAALLGFSGLAACQKHAPPREDRAPLEEQATTWSGLQGDDLLYLVLVDRFANGDPSNDANADPADPSAFHGGDLQGVTDRLDALVELGVTAIWLTPVFETQSTPFHGHGAFHGYWVDDLDTVDGWVGGEAALVDL